MFVVLLTLQAETLMKELAYQIIQTARGIQLKAGPEQDHQGCSITLQPH